MRKSWLVKRRNDRIKKLERVTASVNPDSDSDWSDDDEPTFAPSCARRLKPWEDEHVASIPRLVLPPPIVRQSMGVGRGPVMLVTSVTLDSN